MIAQGMYVLATERPKPLARKRWTVAWQLLSHRVLRWMGPLFLLGALGASADHAPGRPLYLALFVAQVAFYTVALGGALAEGLGARRARWPQRTLLSGESGGRRGILPGRGRQCPGDVDAGPVGLSSMPFTIELLNVGDEDRAKRWETYVQGNAKLGLP